MFSVILSLWAWRLKSDQNGIEIVSLGTFKDMLRRLKSDQNGIEISASSGRRTAQQPLKSDQNGIEIPNAADNFFNAFNVKIRPKWD